MKVYIFCGDYFSTILLPTKINGMYPIYYKNRLIVNISSKETYWELIFSDEFNQKEFNSSFDSLIPYKIYNFISTYNQENVYVVAVPRYDDTTKIYNIKDHPTFLIGNTPKCDICYQTSIPFYDGQDIIKLSLISPTSKKLLIETTSTNFYINGKLAKSGMKLMCGDSVFYFGLRFVYIGDIGVINNPTNSITINYSPFIIDSIAEYKNIDSNTRAKEEQQNDVSLYNKEDYFYKSPRLSFDVKSEDFTIDEPPSPVLSDDTPIILTIGPQMTMVCTSVFSMVSFIDSYINGTATGFRFAISMGTIGITILGAVLWPSITHVFNNKRLKKAEIKRKDSYSKYLDRKAYQLSLIKSNQKANLNKNYPTPLECTNIIKSKSKELWQKSIDQEDFLTIRLGIGTGKTKINLTEPKEKFSVNGEDVLFKKMKDIIDQSLIMDEVPISYSFTKKNAVAIIGKEELLKELLDSVFLQILTFHSYADLKIIVFTKSPEKWDYLKITPHCWNNKKSLRYFTTNTEELSSISTDLEKIFDLRVSDDDEVKKEDDGEKSKVEKTYKDYKPYYLFFVDDVGSIRNISLFNKIFNYKRNIGFSIIVTSEEITSLPNSISDFICVTPEQGAIMSSNIESNQTIFKPDYNVDNQIDIYEYAQKLANIPVIIEKEKYELPSSLSFMEMYNLGMIEQFNSLERWNQNNPSISLSVPIGIDQNGKIFKMDIHEKAYGPHGLVAGTTGSGKSEWIITYILSLVVNFSPLEVQFVLIDYKGGGLAKSFENAELGIKLPHLVGTITNLDKSDIFRSVAAIESELRRRQRIFNETREKLKEGSMNIYKYQQLFRKKLVDKPMSHLLIICDEFAELKQQQPEFMEQLISISRIGRSLGIHLILATQKPSGVVNDQIWSNSKFKVCLKVQDKSDSNEIIKKPDAAFLKQTGAFYLQVGNDDYYNLGQSAWAGAPYIPSDSIKRKVDNSIDHIDNIGRIIESYEENKETTQKSKGEQLINIVSYISNLSKQNIPYITPLWLPNIPARINLFDLFKKYNRGKATPYSYNIAIGEYDEPASQKQGLLELNFQDGNIAIIGQNGSNIDGVISTMIWSSICEHTPYEIAYYIIDFGAETLKKFAKFPQVGEVLFQDEIDKIGEILDLIMDEVDKRKELLSDYNGSFSYYNKINEKKLPLIVMVINSFDIFSETFINLNDTITNMFRDLPKYGVIFIVSVNSPNALRQKQLQFFNHTILLQLKDETQYRSITNCARGLVPKKFPGRGICKIDANTDTSYCEFQTAMIQDESRELDLIKAYADKCIAYYNYKVKQLVKIPNSVSSEELTKYITTAKEVPIGINFYEKNIARIDLLSQKVFVITGKKISDNMPFIYGLTNIISKLKGVKVRLVDMSKIFKNPILDIKMFNDDLNTVFGALEHDVLTRNETQDMAVNIIIGIGQFKNKLSAGGILILRNLFSNLPNSKQSTYIFIDDYEYIKMLKMETWFESVNLNNGIWLGSEFSNQSIFKSQELTKEDKKYNYDGLAFNIVNGEYKVIKTVMDKDE